jgi:hypothetical protein
VWRSSAQALIDDSLQQDIAGFGIVREHEQYDTHENDVKQEQKQHRGRKNPQNSFQKLN